MTLEKLIANLKDAGANDNTMQLAINCYELGKQAQRPAIAWDTKEMWLQSWLPRLKDALQDVRNKQNSEAAETLYELYVEMNQQTLAEKIDTLGEMCTEDLLSSTVAELLATKKRLADVEGILCRHHFEQAQKQEPVAWITQGGKGWLRWHKSYDDNKNSVPLYLQPQEAALHKQMTSQERDAHRWRFLMENSYDSESVTQFHVWEHSWEPHSQTGEPTEWKQRVRGIALIDFIDRAIETAHGITGEKK